MNFPALVIVLFIAALSSNTLAFDACAVHWPPYTISNESGDIIGGSSYEIHQQAFKLLGINLKVKKVPWKRCIHEVKNGSYDAVFDADPTTYEKLLFSSHVTIYNPITIFVRKNFKEKFSVYSLKGKPVGMPEGYGGYLKIANFYGWHIVEAVGEESVLRMLKHNRIDYVLLDLVSTPALTRKINLEVKPLRPSVSMQKLSIGFSPDKQNILSMYDLAFNKLIKNGVVDEIYKRHLPFSYTEVAEQIREAGQKY